MWTLADVERINKKRAASAQIPGAPGSPGSSSAPGLPAAKGVKKEPKMNKTEAAYARRLEALKYAGEVLWYAFEPVNIRLADNTYYRPDFMVMLASGEVQMHETKGFWRDDARVKIKVAAEILPFKFVACRLVKGDWEFEYF